MDSMQFLSKPQVGFFAEMDKLFLECIWKFKRCRKAKTIVQKNKVGGLTLSDFRMYNKALIIKTV